MSDADEDRVELLVLRAGDRRVAVESGRVEEVVAADGDPTRVPMTDDAVEGVVDVRGEVTAVVDGRAVLGVDNEAPAVPPGVGGAAVGEARSDPGPDQLVVFRRGSGDPVAMRIDGVETVRIAPLSAFDRDPDPERVRTAVAGRDDDAVDPGIARAVVTETEDGDAADDLAVVDVAGVAALTTGTESGPTAGPLQNE